MISGNKNLFIQVNPDPFYRPEMAFVLLQSWICLTNLLPFCDPSGLITVRVNATLELESEQPLPIRYSP